MLKKNLFSFNFRAFGASYLLTSGALLAFLVAASPSFSQESSVSPSEEIATKDAQSPIALDEINLDSATTLPTNATKTQLLEFQANLTRIGRSISPNDAEKFFEKTANAFYESTKALLACDLDAEERAEYSSQFAQILATFALEEGIATQKLGPKFDELTATVDAARAKFESEPSDETRRAYLEFSNYSFLVRLRFAQNLPQKTRDEAFATLASDAISFALINPEYGPNAFDVVASIRAFSPKVGAESFEKLCLEFEASKNPALTKPIETFLGRARFARLPGGEMKFEGLLLKDGDFTEKFDWKDYQGKVVLIEFWATWCGPCRKEFPKLKEEYAKYQQKGLEIIGYSIDDDVEKLKSFVVENELPWKIVSQKASNEAGYVGLYDYYAINGVPELILIGRDGKVIQTDARGPKLTEALEKLFPAESESESETKTEFEGAVIQNNN